MTKKPLLVIFLTVFIDLVGFGIIIPMNPYLARQFGADPLAVGLLMSIYSLMQFIFSPIWGGISDRIGRRPVIFVSLAGVGISYIVFAFATSYWLLFIARAFGGLFGGSIATAMAYIADVTSERDRSKGMGLIGAAFGLGFILGPALGGLFSEVGSRLGDVPPFGPSFSAIVAATISLLNLFFAYRFLPESLSPEVRARVKPRPSRFMALAHFIKQPTLGTVFIIYFLSSLAMAHMEASLFLYVQDKFNWDMRSASFGFAYVGVIMVFTQGFLIRRLMPKFGERTLLILGLMLGALGMAGIGSAPSILVLAVAVTLLSLGVGMINPSSTGTMSLLTEAAEQGQSLGVAQSLAALGRIVGPGSGGLVYREWGWSAPFFVASTLMILGLLLSLKILAKLPTAGRASARKADLDTPGYQRS